MSPLFACCLFLPWHGVYICLPLSPLSSVFLPSQSFLHAFPPTGETASLDAIKRYYIMIWGWGCVQEMMRLLREERDDDETLVWGRPLLLLLPSPRSCLPLEVGSPGSLLFLSFFFFRDAFSPPASHLEHGGRCLTRSSRACLPVTPVCLVSCRHMPFPASHAESVRSFLISPLTSYPLPIVCVSYRFVIALPFHLFIFLGIVSGVLRRNPEEGI